MGTKLLRGALVGAPNCGKSTLFNRLTGARVSIGNRAGVTVDASCERVRGRKICAGCPDFYLVDLPGLCSLSASGADEEVTVHSLASDTPDFIINVLCATTLERCLTLTLELRERYPRVPMICAVNMCDELTKGVHLMPDKLSESVGVPVVGISASRGDGMAALGALIRDTAKLAAAAPARSGGDDSAVREDSLAGKEEASSRTALYRAALAKRAARAAAASLTGAAEPHTATDRADKILTHPTWGAVIFFGIMALMFSIVFGSVGELFTEVFELLILQPFTRVLSLLEYATHMSPTAVAMVEGCVVSGVAAVISFLPRIALLFLLLSLLEDSGYMARAAFVMDARLRPFGLSGRAFIPTLLGVGCSVPAILAARTLTDRAERWRCVMLTPLISCSARLPVYTLLASTFFPRTGGLIICGIYLIGVVVFLVLSGFLRHTTKTEVPLFVAELPRFRWPRPRVVLTSALRRAGEFLSRAASVIFLSAVVVWLLSALTPSFSLTPDMDSSLLCVIASAISPLLALLGLDDWRAVAALMSGLGAKEAIISTFGVLLGGNLSETLMSSGIFTPASALSFMVFCSMYAPCLATVAAMKKELGSTKKTAVGLVLMFAAAYFIAVVVYRVAMGLG
ncbi:MAG: ferrous iron transport protein B [Clostridia bacterium]|nr:ferrous iron transport protein B [Clostridia bacterium]